MYIVDYVTPGRLSDSTISTFLISRKSCEKVGKLKYKYLKIVLKLSN